MTEIMNIRNSAIQPDQILDIAEMEITRKNGTQVWVILIWQSQVRTSMAQVWFIPIYRHNINLCDARSYSWFPYQYIPNSCQTCSFELLSCLQISISVYPKIGSSRSPYGYYLWFPYWLGTNCAWLVLPRDLHTGTMQTYVMLVLPRDTHSGIFQTCVMIVLLCTHENNSWSRSQ